MSIFKKFFRKEATNYGIEAIKLISGFLKNCNLKFTEYTLTEMYAFLYIMIDLTMFTRQISSRDTIAKDILGSHFLTTKYFIQKDDETLFVETLKARVDEYATMFQEGKDPSDMIEKLDFYLNHASDLNEFYVDGSTIFIGDAFDKFQNRLALTEFHVHKLLPFIEDIVNKES